MTHSKWTYLAAAVAAAGTLTMLAELASAQSNRYNRGHGTITVESTSGNGRVSGRIRVRNGYKEVQLPGGTWMSCFAGCAYTLRTETIDFWETLQEDGGGDGRN